MQKNSCTSECSTSLVLTSCRKTEELYLELPDEAKAPRDGDVVGRMNRSMYGFRDAGNNWMRDWRSLHQSTGYARTWQIQSSAVLQHTAKFVRCSSWRRLPRSFKQERKKKTEILEQHKVWVWTVPKKEQVCCTTLPSQDLG